MSSKSVLQECQVRVSSKKGVLQECHLSVSRQGVPQVGSLENVISIVSVLQHTCRHSGSWASSCFSATTTTTTGSSWNESPAAGMLFTKFKRKGYVNNKFKGRTNYIYCITTYISTWSMCFIFLNHNLRNCGTPLNKYGCFCDLVGYLKLK